MSKKSLPSRLFSKELLKDKLTVFELILQLILVIAILWINLASLSSSTLLIETRYSNTLNGGGLIDPKDWRAGALLSVAALLIAAAGTLIPSALHKLNRPVFARMFILLNLILLSILVIVAISYSVALGN